MFIPHPDNLQSSMFRDSETGNDFEMHLLLQGDTFDWKCRKDFEWVMNCHGILLCIAMHLTWRPGLYQRIFFHPLTFSEFSFDLLTLETSLISPPKKER